MRRRSFIKVSTGVGIALVAGCAGDGTGTGEFRLLISDQPTAIEAFDSLDVTLSSARVFQTDDDAEITTGAVNGTATETTDGDGSDGRGFVEFDLDSVTVDLTQVKGDRAVAILEGELEEGRYSGIELRVASADGVVDGEDVDVTVPSDRLRLVRPFDIGADEELSFVFDINVVKKGQREEYNLLPVIGKSGVAGQDVDVEEVEIEDGGE